MFEGIEADEKIGDFGLVGDGAAGLELDFYEPSSGTPPEALVAATSEDHTDIYLEVLEELYFNVPGSAAQSARVRGGHRVLPDGERRRRWSAGSIACCGSLSHNGYDNNVSGSPRTCSTASPSTSPRRPVPSDAAPMPARKGVQERRGGGG